MPWSPRCTGQIRIRNDGSCTEDGHRSFGDTHRPFGDTQAVQRHARPQDVRRPAGHSETHRVPFGDMHKPFGDTRRPFEDTRGPFGDTHRPPLGYSAGCSETHAGRLVTCCAGSLLLSSAVPQVLATPSSILNFVIPELAPSPLMLVRRTQSSTRQASCGGSGEGNGGGQVGGPGTATPARK